MKEVSYLLEYLLLKGSLSLIRKIGRDKAFKIGDILAEIIYYYPRIKRVTEENLLFAGFPLEVGKESLKSFIRCSIDFIKSTNYSFEYLKKLFKPVDPSTIPSEGGILLTAHIGNWELMGALFSVLSDGKLSVVAKPMKNHRVDKLINSIRQKWGIKVIPTGNVIEIVKDLKKNRYVGILLDQRPKVKEGVLTDFLGRETYTNKGVALLSIKTGKPIIPAFCFVENDKYVIETYKPIYPDGKTVEELTKECTKAIEKAVRKHPEQWFWFHRRWKNSPEFKKWKEKNF
ncbi:lipid A biosynthesis acyltransferase [Desulfurobacterium thermolithotrophum DSM 11699]|uniref:Lipid A biosynthesis acyltransferase n=1 Tax=Desulfurobacterium thermolithotrophum (strain DSM 11699 / BSA) TaxID=868864 RepID=F0S1V6_DESTD|nr:lysophospholipid acyltransferase family protein [Desulfurobacterium thermolithotrophum]ADY72961.1 lipid A biosynthesis acyltransferase [Desulfurobacterium thermolithotrophum DSM 11699]